jgi:hypothetical protein
MATLISGAVAVAVLYLLLQMIRTANPALIAKGVRMGGGVLALAVAAFTGLRGELAVALPLGLFGAGLLGWSPMTGAFGHLGSIFGGASSRMRAPALELTLNSLTGAIDGTVLTGPQAGRQLSSFDLRALLGLGATFDAESAALLEGYLDRRFPGWRQHAQGDAAGRGRSRATGKMTDEEAYEILGLKPGASLDDITRAHRTLMKKLHPDQGGSTYLAARVNEARDILLRTHRT